MEDKKQMFEELLTDNKDVIYRVCWGFTSNKEDIKDLFQEVVLNIWKGLEGFRNEAKTSTWIHRVAMNTCLVWKRKIGRTDQIEENVIAENIYQEEASSHEINPKILQLKNTIQELKPTDRSLIILLLEGHSYEEIADITGMTINNVGVKISRAKTKIKKLINQT